MRPIGIVYLANSLSELALNPCHDVIFLTCLEDGFGLASFTLIHTCSSWSVSMCISSKAGGPGPVVLLLDPMYVSVTGGPSERAPCKTSWPNFARADSVGERIYDFLEKPGPDMTAAGPARLSMPTSVDDIRLSHASLEFAVP